MTDRPILFKAEMVRALLDGRKTQTRRVLKLHPSIDNKSFTVFPPEEIIELTPGEFRAGVCHYLSTGALSGPYKIGYTVGDRIWARETFVVESNFNIDSNTGYPRPFNDGRPAKYTNYHHDGGSYWEQCHYRATDEKPELSYDDVDGPHCRWKPSIFMPRWASRITLIVTDVRAERVQDISEADAKAEGGQKLAFAGLWERINAKRGYGWEANPWVTPITFEVIQQNIDQIHKQEGTA